MPIDPYTGLETKASNAGRGLDPWTFPYISPQGAGATVGRTNPAGSGAPGTAGAAGGPVDYASLIKNDPLFSQFRADLGAQGIADAGSRRAALNQALVAFGEVIDPSALSSQLGFNVAGEIDPTTAQLAAQNTQAGTSLSARLVKQNKDNIRAIKNALAARGALRSGETGHQLNEEQLRFSQGQYDARAQVLDYLKGVQAAYVQSERQRKMAEQQEMMATIQRLLASGAYGGGGGGGGGGGAAPAPQGAAPQASGGVTFPYGLPDPWQIGAGVQGPRQGDTLPVIPNSQGLQPVYNEGRWDLNRILA